MHSGPTTAPRRLLRAAAPVVLLVWLLVWLLGCTPGATSSDEEPDDQVADLPTATVTIPPVRLTPFCQEMIDLAERLEVDPPDDITAEIIATYERIDADVPDAIREDFDAVLADLRGEPVPDASPDESAATQPPTVPSVEPSVESGGSVPAGDPFFDEGYDPDDDPALRLNAYVDFECRDVANNPGPPATQPLSEPTTTDG